MLPPHYAVLNSFRFKCHSLTLPVSALHSDLPNMMLHIQSNKPDIEGMHTSRSEQHRVEGDTQSCMLGIKSFKAGLELLFSTISDWIEQYLVRDASDTEVWDTYTHNTYILRKDQQF